MRKFKNHWPRPLHNNLYTPVFKRKPDMQVFINQISQPSDKVREKPQKECISGKKDLEFTRS